MDSAIASLLAANVTFVGSHFVLSHPLRAPLWRTLGEKGFMALYSLVAFAAIAWVVMAFRSVGPGGTTLWNGQATVPWIAASLLTLIAAALLLGSFKGNPAVPGAPAALAQATPTGAFAVTRHPMMWSFALWAVAHIVVSPNARTAITAGAMGTLALVGARLQDRKKQALMGEAWREWQAHTTYWPRWSALAGLPPLLWSGALAFWLAATWAHLPAAYVPAGVWRWF